MKKYNTYNLINPDYIDDPRNTAVLLKTNSDVNLINSNYNTNDDFYDRLTKSEKEFIESNWNETLAKNQNNQLFNGNLINLNTIEFDNRLILNFSKTDYRAHIITRRKEYLKVCNNNTSHISTPLSVLGISETSDNKIVIGTRKNDKTKFSMAGGMFSPDNDIINGKLNFINTTEREINEELCKLTFGKWSFIGIVGNKKSIFATIILYSKVEEDFEYIKNAHNPKDIVDFWEMPEIYPINVNANSLSQALFDKNKQLVGTNLSALLLFGRVKFGEEWYYSNGNAILGDCF